MESDPHTSETVKLFTESHTAYARFISAVGYPQGIRAFFQSSSLLKSGLRVLDAGCGTGVITLALHDAMIQRGHDPGTFNAFDLTPAMLDRFHRTLQTRGMTAKVVTMQANVLELEKLPEGWSGYDLIVTASMLEYIPRNRLPEALAALRQRLSDTGRIVLFITKRNWLMRPLIGWWWRSNLYTGNELFGAFHTAGFRDAKFLSFPPAASHLALWGHVVEAGK
jgi:ubiquinone/menaquinone biosynthesis C-methylase UbiE